MADALTEETKKAMAEASARTLLWALTGRRYGMTQIVNELYTVVPCGDTNRVTPYFEGGRWFNGCAGGCCWLELHSQPVQEVTEVSVNGEVTTDWTLVNGRLKIEGGCSSCAQCPDPTISVSYWNGLPMPLAGIAAQHELECEYMKALNGENCKLPSRAISITRQGVTIDMPDATNLVNMSLTGLPITDDFIRSVNPAKLVSRSRTYSPDLPRVAR